MRAAFVSGLLACIGCSTSEGIPSGTTQPGGDSDPAPPPSHSIRVTPGDLTSSTTITPLMLYVDYPGNAPDKAAPTLNAVAADLSLQTYPEASAVSFSTKVTLPQGIVSGATLPETGTIEIQPTMPLQDRWYILLVNALPTDVTVNSKLEADVAADMGARLIGRFNPGSSPVMREVRVCKNASSADVSGEVAFSESIEPNVSTLMTVSGVGPNTACTVHPQSNLTTKVWFACPMAVWEEQKIELSFPAGIKSGTGNDLGVIDDEATTDATLVSTSAYSEVFDLSGHDQGPNCRAVRPML
jgi:hypothetical protein